MRWSCGTASTCKEGWGRQAYLGTSAMSVCLVSTFSEGIAGWEARSLWQNHRITEIGKRPLRSMRPIINPALPAPPLNHGPECHSYKSFKYLQGWWSNHFQCMTTLDGSSWKWFWLDSIIVIAYVSVITTPQTPSYHTAFSTCTKISKESSTMTAFNVLSLKWL